MASELIWTHTGTGKTVYVTIRSAVRTYWYTVTPELEALTMAHWADYDIALTETPASSFFYVGDWPAALTTVGFYWVDVFEQAGVGPVRADDTLIGGIIGYWNGTAVLPWAADVTQISGDSTAADRLEAFLDAMLSGAVVDDDNPHPTASTFKTDLSAASHDFFNDAFVLFYSGALQGQSRKISDYSGSTKVLVFAKPFTTAPSAGDAFIVIGRSE